MYRTNLDLRNETKKNLFLIIKRFNLLEKIKEGIKGKALSKLSKIQIADALWKVRERWNKKEFLKPLANKIGYKLDEDGFFIVMRKATKKEFLSKAKKDKGVFGFKTGKKTKKGKDIEKYYKRTEPFESVEDLKKLSKNRLYNLIKEYELVNLLKKERGTGGLSKMKLKELAEWLWSKKSLWFEKDKEKPFIKPEEKSKRKKELEYSDNPLISGKNIDDMIKSFSFDPLKKDNKELSWNCGAGTMMVFTLYLLKKYKNDCLIVDYEKIKKQIPLRIKINKLRQKFYKGHGTLSHSELMKLSDEIRELRKDIPYGYEVYPFKDDDVTIYAKGASSKERGGKGKYDLLFPSSNPPERVMKGQSNQVKTFKGETGYFEMVKSCGLRGNNIIITPLFIHGHANMLIINYKQKTAERFEPHGRKIGRKVYIGQEKNLKKAFKRHGYTYINQDLTCPLPTDEVSSYGLQSSSGVLKPSEKEVLKWEKEIDRGDKKVKVKMDSFSGYCCAWSLFYAELRLKYPTLTSKQVIKLAFDIIRTKENKVKQTDVWKKGYENWQKGKTQQIETRILNLHTFIANYVRNIRSLMADLMTDGFKYKGTPVKKEDVYDIYENMKNISNFREAVKTLVNINLMKEMLKYGSNTSNKLTSDLFKTNFEIDVERRGKVVTNLEYDEKTDTFTYLD